MLATVLLAVFWRRATGHGAFAGLIAGAIAALLHHGLALPAGEQRGIHGGWIAVLHHPSSELRFTAGTGLLAFAASVAVSALVSLCTQARVEREPAASAPAATMKLDLRIPMGMLFTFIGTILAAFGLATRDHPDLYAKSLGIDMNLWSGFVLLAFGVTMLTLGRRGQTAIDKAGSREQGSGNRKR